MLRNYFNTAQLLTGNTGAATGEWIQIKKRGGENLFTVYANGSGVVDLEYKSPFFDEGIVFYSVSITGSGYADPLYSTSPFGEIRATSYGTGRFWAAVTYQNM